MNGGLPAAHSNRSVVCEAQPKKSPTWIFDQGDRDFAFFAATASCSIPKQFMCDARNRPSPHDGSNKRSARFRITQRTRMLATGSGVKKDPVLFVSAITM